jgi:rhomboid protease GluP
MTETPNSGANPGANPSAPPTARTEPEHLAAFHRHLATLTPRVWVTPLIVLVNVAVYIAFGVVEHSWMTPQTSALQRWGASFGPLTEHGQWWRLFTSTFLHIGLLHILMNMAVLWEIGRFVERMLGHVGFLLFYVVCGLAGQLASVAWNPYVTSAGASGAIFGLYGVLLGFLVRSRGSIPKEVLQRLQKSAVVFIGYNVFYGLAQTGIDNAAHFGGIGAGFVLGLLAAQPLTLDARPKRLKRAVLAALPMLALIAGTARALPKAFNVQSEMASFEGVEKRLVERYDTAGKENRAGKLTDAGLADVLEKELVPEWHAERERMRGLDKVPGLRKQFVEPFRTYLAAREEHWTLLAKAVRTSDPEVAKQAAAKEAEANAALDQLNQR